MPRRKNADPSQEIAVQVPQTLLAKVDLYLFDPVRGGVRYGARSKLITRLLREWVADREAATLTQAKNSARVQQGADND